MKGAKIKAFLSIALAVGGYLLVTGMLMKLGGHDRLPTPSNEVELRRLNAELRSLSERVTQLEELAYLAGEERFLLSKDVHSLSCRVSHLVTISRVGWWHKETLASLRRCGYDSQ